MAGKASGQLCDKTIVQALEVDTLPLQILTNRNHCRRFLKTFHDLDEGIILPPPELPPTTQHQTGLTQHQTGMQPPPPPAGQPPPPPPGQPLSPPPGQPPSASPGPIVLDSG